MTGQMQWQDVFQVVVFLGIGFLGAPLTQFLKNKLGWKDKAAIALTAGVSLGLAAAQQALSGLIGANSFTIENLPATFFAMFGLASMYYGWLKGSDSIFGKGGLLKEPKQDPVG